MSEMIPLVVTVAAIYGVSYGALWVTDRMIDLLLERYRRLREMQIRAQVLEIEIRALGRAE